MGFQLHFKYSNIEDYDRASDELEPRSRQSRTIPGTRKYHSFLPISTEKVIVRLYSSSTVTKEETVTLTQTDLSAELIITCRSNGWLV